MDFRLIKLWLVFYLLEKSQGFTTKVPMDSRRREFFELSVIHINDFHARFLEINPTSGVCNRARDKECIGGIARVSTASRRLLAERPNSIFLNAGDHFQGTLWYNYFKWNVTVEFMNRLPHDALTIGNHEFDDKIDGLIPFLQNINAPVVISNINDTLEPRIKGFYQNSTIIQRGERKIGVIGVILSSTNLIARTEQLIFYDEVEAVNSEAEKLRSQGIDIIIVLSHCGINIDKIIAAKCPNIDVIVGGHTHTFLYTGKRPYIDVPEDVYPVHVKQEGSGRTVLIVQASAFTRYIGNLTVWFDNRGEVVDWEGNPILLDQSIKEDPQILKALEPWKELENIKGKEIVGSTKVFLHGLNQCRMGECNLGNLIADSMIDYYASKNNDSCCWTQAAISIVNAGGIRDDISNTSESITLGDLLVVLPFENTVNLVEMRGGTILKALERAVLKSYTPYEFVGSGYLQWSGLKVTFNLSNSDNSRVIDVQVRCQFCIFPKYESLLPEKWYNVTVSSFLLNGGDNHTEIQHESRFKQEGPLDLRVAIDFIRKKSPITYGTEGRAILLGDWYKI